MSENEQHHQGTPAQHHVEESPPTVRVPPTVRGEMTKQTQSVWPMVLAIISLVFGIMSLLGACINIGSVTFGNALWEVIPDDDATALDAALAESSAFVISSSIVWLLLSIALLVGAGGLMRRKHWGVKTCVVWAVLKIVYELAVIYPAIEMQSQQLQLMAEEGPPEMAKFMQVFMVVGILLGLAIGVALPIFLLIWFRRPRIKEEIAGWK